MMTTCPCRVATSYTALLPFGPSFLFCTTLRPLRTNNGTPCSYSRWYSRPSPLHIFVRNIVLYLQPYLLIRCHIWVGSM